MKKPGDYLMKRYLNVASGTESWEDAGKAQATIEFTLAFVTAVLFLVLTCNLFVWLNHDIVRRQRAYEETRSEAAHGDPGKLDFYTSTSEIKKQPMNLFTPGGYNR